MMPLLTLPRSWRKERTLRWRSLAPWRSYMSASSWPGRTVNTQWWSASRADRGETTQRSAEGVEVDGDGFFHAPGGGQPAEPFDVPQVLLNSKAIEQLFLEAGDAGPAVGKQEDPGSCPAPAHRRLWLGPCHRRGWILPFPRWWPSRQRAANVIAQRNCSAYLIRRAEAGRSSGSPTTARSSSRPSSLIA